jgi:hypothetical protein
MEMDNVDKFRLEVYNEINRLRNLRTLVFSSEDGGTLQFKSNGEWVDHRGPISLGWGLEFRIKPREPRKIYGYFADGGEFYSLQRASSLAEIDLVTFIEVLKQP